MAITIQTYERFNTLTNYKLNKFVAEVGDFMKTEYPAIVSFYLGNSDFIDGKLIKKLNSLTEESIKVTAIFSAYKNIMPTVDYWELLDLVEDLRTHLQYAQNVSKYVRSSIIKGKVKAGYVFNYTMSEEETLEDVSRTVSKSADWRNDWAQIGIENDLREVDWDIDGGTELELVDKTFQAGLVTSMIDNTIGDRVYGKDLKKLLEFEDDDLMVLGYKETALQTVEILSTLAKADIPEFPNLGLDANVWKGTNISKINFPLISREMRGVFDTDDLFQDFKVRNIEYVDGDLSIEFEVGTKRGLVVVNNITI